MQCHVMPGSRLPIAPGDVQVESGIGPSLLADIAEIDHPVIANHSPVFDEGGRFGSGLPPGERLLPIDGWTKSAK